MRTILSLAILIFSCTVYQDASGQSFKVIFDTTNSSTYIGHRIRYISDDIFQFTDNHIKSESVGLYIVKPIFIEVGRTQILAIPGQSLRGSFTEDGEFHVEDSNNLNSFLADFTESMSNITRNYNKTVPYVSFTRLYDSLEFQIARQISNLTNPINKKKYRLDNSLLFKIREYAMMKLAHFSVLPILYKAPYSDLFSSRIKKDIAVRDPSLWLQVQAGQIFLKTYFIKDVLPNNSYDLEKAMASNSILKGKLLGKYISYQYFKSLTENESIERPKQVTDPFKKYKNSYEFTKAELKHVNQLNISINLSGQNIKELFAKQVLITSGGIQLGHPQKEALLNTKEKLIIDYWASWCIPCIDFISKLKSDKIIYKGEVHKIIFISIDASERDWLSKQFPIFNTKNNFKLTDFNAPSFFTAFKVQAIPRLFLIKNGIMLNQNYEREKID